MISLDQLVLSSPKTPVHLPLDIQRYVLLKGLEKPSHYCPKDNSANLRDNGRMLSQASLVNREWKAMCYPLLYASVTLPRAYHLALFMRTLDETPALGEFVVYFHYFAQVLPDRFLERVFYKMPNLAHFLSQADATRILDVDPTHPKPKLITLEVDPGLHDDEGNYVDAHVERWCDLSELKSLALVGMEALNNVLAAPLANLQELHLLHHEDDLDPHPDSHHLILSILEKVGRQLLTLRIDEFSSEILLAPAEVFALCPNLITFSVSGLDLGPLLAMGHPTLKHLLIGDPWNYHNRVADGEEGVDVRHELADEDRDVIRAVLAQADRAAFPALRAILLWNVSFKEEEHRRDRDIKHMCDELHRRHGWLVGDRFACGRDPSWGITDDFGSGRSEHPA